MTNLAGAGEGKPRPTRRTVENFGVGALSTLRLRDHRLQAGMCSNHTICPRRLALFMLAVFKSARPL